MPPAPEAIPPLPPEMLARALESALDAEAPETARARMLIRRSDRFHAAIRGALKR